MRVDELPVGEEIILHVTLFLRALGGSGLGLSCGLLPIACCLLVFPLCSFVSFVVKGFGVAWLPSSCSSDDPMTR